MSKWGKGGVGGWEGYRRGNEERGKGEGREKTFERKKCFRGWDPKGLRRSGGGGQGAALPCSPSLSPSPPPPSLASDWELPPPKPPWG